jgi:glutamine amidotransferase
MCRLFGMFAAPQRVRATFWLIDAPDSLVLQSRKEPDGVGPGHLRTGRYSGGVQGTAAAYADSGFAREAHELSASMFIAHIRYATTGALDLQHPPVLPGRPAVRA